jgi:predicted dithiol-disulfide oxidoreductase (DUF899 family)
VSRTSRADIARVKARMGWKMPWYTLTDKISTASHPHVMYFAPNVSGMDIGSGELG